MCTDADLERLLADQLGSQSERAAERAAEHIAERIAERVAERVAGPIATPTRSPGTRASVSARYRPYHSSEQPCVDSMQRTRATEIERAATWLNMAIDVQYHAQSVQQMHATDLDPLPAFLIESPDDIERTIRRMENYVIDTVATLAKMLNQKE